MQSQGSAKTFTLYLGGIKAERRTRRRSTRPEIPAWTSPKSLATSSRHRPRIGCRFPQRSSGAARAANLINAHIAFAPPPAAAGQRPNDDRMEAQPRSISPVNGPADRHELPRFIPCPDLAAEENRQRKTRRAEPSGHHMGFAPTPLILTVGMPQRVRNSQTFSPLKAQPRAATKPCLIEYCGDLLVHFTGPV